MGKADLAKYCGCRRGVGWSDDGAKRDRDGPWHSRQRVCHGRNRSRRKANRDQHQAGHGQPVVLEVARRRIVGGIKQDGREEECQGQFWFEDDARRTGNEGQ
jgi:hypothetical protein